MQVNIEIRNNGALPIPYINKVGDKLWTKGLFKDKSIFTDALSISSTVMGQFVIHSKDHDIIIDQVPALEILFV